MHAWAVLDLCAVNFVKALQFYSPVIAAHETEGARVYTLFKRGQKRHPKIPH